MATVSDCSLVRARVFDWGASFLTPSSPHPKTMLLCSATAQPGVVFRRRAVRCAVVSCSSAESSPSTSFRTLLSSCGADLGACYDGAGALQVGPARKALKAASTAACSPLAAAAPPQLLAALGCAASQALAAQPCALPWVGSPEPGDGVASSARRLVDCFLHGVEAPAPRLLDASLLLLAFALAEERALSEDAACVATLVGHALAGVTSGSPPKAALARLLADAPARSASAARADEQARYAELAEVKAAASELNARAAEKRRLARGDWKCAFCATVNFRRAHAAACVL